MSANEKPTLLYINNLKKTKTPLVIRQEPNTKADLTEKNNYVVDRYGNEYPLHETTGQEKQPAGIPILKKEYHDTNKESFIIKAAMDFTGPLLENNIRGIYLTHQKYPELAVQTAFDILQATGLRITKTEFIACPSCGRTLFDIQKELQKVKKATSHLKGLKIAVMGCIVNGPGEMADADYGYVGSGKNKVTLYKGKTIQLKNINAFQAVDALVKLIKENEDWLEKN